MLDLPCHRYRAHQYVDRLMCHGLGLRLLHGNSILLSSHNKPVTSASRSVDTTTPVADATKVVAPVRSSPPKKGPKSSKPSNPTQQYSSVHELELQKMYVLITSKTASVITHSSIRYTMCTESSP